MSAPIVGPASPGAMISSHSTMLRSWRTLPGQSPICSSAIASSQIARAGSPAASAARCMKWRGEHRDVGRAARPGAGTRSGTTFSR